MQLDISPNHSAIISDQLIGHSLQDSSRDIREALHELLCYTNVSTKECIQLALVELLKNLTKYPTDRNSVWKWVQVAVPVRFSLSSSPILSIIYFFLLHSRCLKFLGARHPTLVLPIVPELLSTHPYFDTPEPDMDDPACILHIWHNMLMHVNFYIAFVTLKHKISLK